MGSPRAACELPGGGTDALPKGAAMIDLSAEGASTGAQSAPQTPTAVLLKDDERTLLNPDKGPQLNFFSKKGHGTSFSTRSSPSVASQASTAKKFASSLDMEVRLCGSQETLENLRRSLEVVFLGDQPFDFGREDSGVAGDASCSRKWRSEAGVREFEVKGRNRHSDLEDEGGAVASPGGAEPEESLPTSPEGAPDRLSGDPLEDKPSPSFFSRPKLSSFRGFLMRSKSL
mmetsp:Transcript_37181/g.91527  ORF Transcript_37181/g.91527 Transcript_37181/m.91527 type:complete len:230 (+) Transcript_37181:167-856(+)